MTDTEIKRQFREMATKAKLLIDQGESALSFMLGVTEAAEYFTYNKLGDRELIEQEAKKAITEIKNYNLRRLLGI